MNFKWRFKESSKSDEVDGNNLFVSAISVDGLFDLGSTVPSSMEHSILGLLD
jgi:hypothetical protein